MKKVNIILSTYNGEEYLAQMFDSILAQTYRNIDVYIRDDGSSDHTLNIVRQYCEKKEDGIRFRLIRDDMGNLRSWRSFSAAVMASEPADYYAFADQDDIWNPDKIRRAVEILDQKPEDQPFLYAAGYEICDLNMQHIGMGRKTESPDNLNVGRCFFNYGAGLGQGFTLVFNHALRKKAFHEGHLEVRGHDVWLWAVTVGFRGGYYYDDYASASYRRHPDTVTPTGKGSWALWKWRLEKFRDKRFFNQIADALQTYYLLFGDQMTRPEDQAFLRLFGDPKNRGKKRLRKAFYQYRLKKTMAEELATRFAFLCGRV